MKSSSTGSKKEQEEAEASSAFELTRVKEPGSSKIPAGGSRRRHLLAALLLNLIKSTFGDSLLCRVCFSELVKLFCAEQSHRKELALFLRGLITSLHVSDERRLRTSIGALQTEFTQPHILAVYFTLPSRRWPRLITNGPFFSPEGREVALITRRRALASVEPRRVGSDREGADLTR